MTDNDTKEQRIRREAIEFALASVRLEGFVVSDKTLAEGEQFIRGEITLDDFMDEHAHLTEPCFLGDEDTSIEIPAFVTLPSNSTKS